MNRRLFINQASTGLALSFLPVSVFAQEPGLPESSVLQPAAKAIQKGLIGPIEQITIIRIYNPKMISADGLKRIAQQDIEDCQAITGPVLSADSQPILPDTPSAAFGTYATKLEINSVRLTWQGLARHGMDNPSSVLSCAIRIFGSAGVFQTTNNGAGYQIQNMAGRIIEQAVTSAV